MTWPSSPQVPSSFDPALHLHSESDAAELSDLPERTQTFSDDIEAELLQQRESVASKARQGIVVQHRRWQLQDAFRSDEDHQIDTPVKVRLLDCSPQEITSQPSPISSSRFSAMPFMSSSPVAYPPTSSPLQESPRKRRKVDIPRNPLADTNGNRRTVMVAGFIDDHSDDEYDYTEAKAALTKRKHAQAGQDESKSADPTKPTEAEGGQIVIQENNTTVQSLDSGSLGLSCEYVTEIGSQASKKPIMIRTSSGYTKYIAQRRAMERRSYEQVIADRSVAVEGRARKSYYGINIHDLFDEETQESALRKETSAVSWPYPSIERPLSANGKPKRTLMWTEKYRARKFTDLIGDERTHRSVLRWLKAWDPIVFPGSIRPKSQSKKGLGDADEDRLHRKVLLVTGPPGLGKTTLAHVCARQAGYEVSEINASDERSKSVVTNRIQAMVGTENVRSVNVKAGSGKVEKAVRPLCIVVDEVDGVVTGNSGSGGEGGFIRALVELIQLDQKNSQRKFTKDASAGPGRKRKGDDFYLRRPIILVCNDAYHLSLRPLRQSGVAEIIHVRKPPLNAVVSRTQSIFEKEGIPCDSDAARRLCEATWGVSSRTDDRSSSGTGEGDIRGIMVTGEWIAAKLRASSRSAVSEIRLTRSWIEKHLLNESSQDGTVTRGVGRGSAKEVVERIFREGGGFPKTVLPAQVESSSNQRLGAVSATESAKQLVMERLRKMLDTNGDPDKVITDCFTAYPATPFQDDTFLSKPGAAYDWLHFHDSLSSAVYSSQEWELQPYLSSSILAFHLLFASTSRHSSWTGSSAKNKSGPTTNDSQAAAQDDTAHPFIGPGAPYAVTEAHRQTSELLSATVASLSAPLIRHFRALDVIATELTPYLNRMLAPNVTPIIINNTSTADKSSSTASVRRAGEKECVARAVNAMLATGVTFARSRIELDDLGASAGGAAGMAGRANGGWIYRMEPALDVLATYETGGKAMVERAAGVRYSVRQVLDTESKKAAKMAEEERRRSRWTAGGVIGDGNEVDFNDIVPDKEQVREKQAAKEKGKVSALKRDFFGRLVAEKTLSSSASESASKRQKKEQAGDEDRVWVSFHEGFSNAVRKPVTIEELMRGF